jgi:hypothetical protein
LLKSEGAQESHGFQFPQNASHQAEQLKNKALEETLTDQIFYVGISTPGFIAEKHTVSRYTILSKISIFMHD